MTGAELLVRIQARNREITGVAAVTAGLGLLQTAITCTAVYLLAWAFLALPRLYWTRSLDPIPWDTVRVFLAASVCISWLRLKRWSSKPVDVANDTKGNKKSRLVLQDDPSTETAGDLGHRILGVCLALLFGGTDALFRSLKAVECCLPCNPDTLSKVTDYYNELARLRERADLPDATTLDILQELDLARIHTCPDGLARVRVVGTATDDPAATPTPPLGI